MKKRLREGAKLIILEPRRIDLVRTPHVEADYHLPLQPGTNVAVVTSLAHVIVTEGLVNEAFVRERCDPAEFRDWAEFVSEERNSPEAVEKVSGVPADLIRKAARLYATGGNAAIYYGLGFIEHSQGSTTVLAIANLALATGNLGRRGVGVNPLRGQNNVQGACDMGSFPHEFAGYRHVSDETARTIYQNLWGVALDREPGLRIPNMLDAAVEGTFMGIYIQGEDILHSDPDTHHVSAGLAAMECVIVQDLFLNELCAHLPAGLFLPGKGRDIYQCRAAYRACAQGDEPQKRPWRLGDHGEARPSHGRADELRGPKRDHGRDRGNDAEFRGSILRQTRRPWFSPMALQ
jgi:formate dehydrogenase major subunit